MSGSFEIPSLRSLAELPYLDANGQLPNHLDGKVGVYAIFDQHQALQFIGYSRDVLFSLKQHLVKHPDCCYGLKVQTIDRPSRTHLETIRKEWIAENGKTPPGNQDEAQWTQPIDVRPQMTSDEQIAYAAADDPGKTKTLKQVARRVEASVLAALDSRGATVQLRFDPKAKEEGLLSLKS